MPEHEGVDGLSAAYQSMQLSWEMVRALEGGTWAMRKASDKDRDQFLPQYAQESNRAWETRKDRAVLTNFFRRAISQLVGKVFSKPVNLDGLSTTLETWSENIDLLGKSTNRFARNVFEDGVSAGLSHILVDFPRMEPGRTLGEERAIGARPYFIHYQAEKVLGARSIVIDGKEILTQVRLLEDSTEADGDFGEVTVKRIRVLDRLASDQGVTIAFRLFQQKDNDEWIEVERGTMGGANGRLMEIPFVTWYTDRTGFMTSRLPFLDLAHLNVAHWQSASDQRNVLTVSRFPILAATGVDEEENIVIGPNNILQSPRAEAKFGYVEHSGAAIAAGRQDLEDLKQEMQLMAMEPILPRTGQPTATGRALDSAEANSIGQELANGLSDVLEQAYVFAAQFSGQEMTGTVKLNTDFGLSMRDATDLDALNKARLAGDISRETLLAEYKRRGVLSDDFDAEEDQELLDMEGPALGMIGREEEPPEDEEPEEDEAA